MNQKKRRKSVLFCERYLQECLFNVRGNGDGMFAKPQQYLQQVEVHVRTDIHLVIE